MNSPKKDVHTILSQSYILYVGLFIVSMFLNSVFNDHINISSQRPLGFLLIIIGPLVMYYAQYTTSKFSRKKDKANILVSDFMYGPYKFSRTPTHVGLLMLFLGYGLLVGSVFVVLGALISFIFAKEIFIKREEKILCEKYGDPYCEYQKRVGKII